MGTRSRETDDSNEFTVEDAQYMIHNCVLFNPKNKMHFRVKNVDFSDDSCHIQCIETGRDHIVMLNWIRYWKIL